MNCKQLNTCVQGVNAVVSFACSLGRREPGEVEEAAPVLSIWLMWGKA